MYASEVIYVKDLATILNTSEAGVRSALQRHRALKAKGQSANLIPPPAKARGRRVCWLRETVFAWLKEQQEGAEGLVGSGADSGVPTGVASKAKSAPAAPVAKVKRGRPRKILG